MAFRNLGQWKSILSRMRGNPTFATSTAPKMKAYAPAADFGHLQETKTSKVVKGEFVPVYVALGMIATSVSFGLYTAWHQLRHAPNVFVKKSRRETLPEVVEPDHVVEVADQFIRKSFFRKVAHVQDYDRHEVIPDPVHGDVFSLPSRAETLKSVGVDPKAAAA